MHAGFSRSALSSPRNSTANAVQSRRHRACSARRRAAGVVVMQRGDRVCPTDTAGVMDAAGRFESGIIKTTNPARAGFFFSEGIEGNPLFAAFTCAGERRRHASPPQASPVAAVPPAPMATTPAPMTMTPAPVPVAPTPVTVTPAPVMPMAMMAPAHLLWLETVHLVLGSNGGTGIVSGRQASVVLKRMRRKRRGMRARGKRGRTRGNSNGDFQEVAAFHFISLLGVASDAGRV